MVARTPAYEFACFPYDSPTRFGELKMQILCMLHRSSTLSNPLAPIEAEPDRITIALS